MARIIIATDLHNTLVFSTEAWLSAYTSLAECSRQEVERRLKNKESRHTIANSLGILYEDVYAVYRKKLRLNMKVINILSELSIRDIPIVVVSSAPGHRVEEDLRDIRDILQIDRVYSRESFSKKNSEDWDRLINLYECDQVLYLGNDSDEDRVIHAKVLSVIINE